MFKRKLVYLPYVLTLLRTCLKIQSKLEIFSLTFYQKYNMSDEITKIEWNDSYLLSVPEIDQQHKQLIAIANELYDVAIGDERRVRN